MQPLAPLEGNPKLNPKAGPGSSNAAAGAAQAGSNARRASHSSSGRPDPLSTITHASVRPHDLLPRSCTYGSDTAPTLQASRIGPGVIPTGLRITPHDDLTPEEKAKRLAAYAAVDEHVKPQHKVIGIG